MPRVFYVLEPDEPHVALILDYVRLLANPLEKHSAHLTIRGPYKQRYKMPSIESKIANAIVEVTGVGTFSKNGQNTVFLRCTSADLRDVWSKPDFGFNPHITIYDGDNTNWAIALYKTLTRKPIRFSFKVSQIKELVSYRAQSEMTLIYSLDSNARLIDSEWSDDLRLSDDLSGSERLEVIEHLVGHLAAFNCLGGESS